MTQFTCKGVKQINNRISFKHLYHSYLSAFFISAGVPNGELPEILIAKCRSRFYCTWFFVGGISCRRKRCVREINVSRAWDPVHAGDKALTRETPAKRGRVNRYESYEQCGQGRSYCSLYTLDNIHRLFFCYKINN
jgi:hypothetical protein